MKCAFCKNEATNICYRKILYDKEKFKCGYALCNNHRIIHNYCHNYKKICDNCYYLHNKNSIYPLSNAIIFIKNKGYCLEHLPNFI